jgi:hypothetical protein
VIEVSAEQHQYDIYIAGSYEAAKEICAEFCEDGFCVSVAPVCFVYKYGREDGVRVTLINYARFPTGRLLIGLRPRWMVGEAEIETSPQAGAQQAGPGV